MKKIIYTRAEDGGLSIVIPAPQAALERVFGPLTVGEYEQHVREKSIPKNAINPRSIEDVDIPDSREFRNAWCDVTPEATIDLDCAIAKEIQLGKLRAARNVELANTDGLMARALELEDVAAIAALKVKRAALRDATEPLKALNAAGKVNCEVTLQAIRNLGVL